MSATREDGAADASREGANGYQDDPGAYHDGTGAYRDDQAGSAEASQARHDLDRDGLTDRDGSTDRDGLTDGDRAGTDEVLTRDPDAGFSTETRVGTDADIAAQGTGMQSNGMQSNGMNGAGTGTQAQQGQDMALVEEPDAMLTRWQEVQTGFVDDPREALRNADALVQQVMKQVAEKFAAERSGMEQQWSRGEDVSTEDMRLVLQRYRTFFNRLLKV